MKKRIEECKELARKATKLAAKVEKRQKVAKCSTEKLNEYKKVAVELANGRQKCEQCVNELTS